jgi:hypothetical protein
MCFRGDQAADVGLGKEMSRHGLNGGSWRGFL